MSTQASSLLSHLRRTGVAATLAATFALVPAIAGAQQTSSECAKGIDLFKARITWIQRIQELQKAKKQTDPGTACSLFGNLGAANARVLAWAKTNQAWCSIEENQITGLEAEAKQVGGVRAKACNVAAQYNKMKHQAEQQRHNQQDNAFSTDMHADPLAPTNKIPPSAL